MQPRKIILDRLSEIEKRLDGLRQELVVEDARREELQGLLSAMGDVSDQPRLREVLIPQGPQLKGDGQPQQKRATKEQQQKRVAALREAIQAAGGSGQTKEVIDAALGRLAGTDPDVRDRILRDILQRKPEHFVNVERGRWALVEESPL